MEKLEQAVHLIEQTDLVNDPLSQILDINEESQSREEYKLKSMAHKLIDILFKVIPMIRSLISQRHTKTCSRSINSISSKSAIMLTVIVKLLSIYSTARNIAGTRSIIDNVIIVEEAVDEHEIETESMGDIAETTMSLEETAKLVAKTLGVESTEEICEILVCLRFDLEDEE